MIQLRSSVFETNSSSSHSLVYTVNSDLDKVDPNCLKPGKSSVIGGSDTEKEYPAVSLWHDGDDENNGLLAICFGNYGGEGNPCITFRDKLSYILTQADIGSGFTFWLNRNYKDKIEIKTEEQGNSAIQELQNSDYIKKILKTVQKRCPNIKGFKFFGFDLKKYDDLKSSYEGYKEKNNINNSLEIPVLEDKYWKQAKAFKDIKVGFGYIDHQSMGFLSDLTEEQIDKILFDQNAWIVITNDNM